MQKKNVIIIILSIVIIAMAIAIICLLCFKSSSKEVNSGKSYSIDGSKMNDEELLKMFEKEGYSIDITTRNTSVTTTYILLTNTTEGITIQRMYNPYIGTQMTFRDENVNDEYADLLYSEDNDTNEKKRQYKAYQSWLEKYNITKTQLSDMLDRYYAENATNTSTNTSTNTTDTSTLGQKNALKQAQSYLQIMTFSKSSLKEQLLFEGYTEAEATYGVDNCGANWNEQAYKKATSYMSIMSFSRTELIEQLEYEGFTSSEIEYAINKIGY